MHKILQLLFIFPFTVMSFGCTAEDEKTKPNILWISIEDLTPMLSCYGDNLSSTPTIDSLAVDGVRFSNAYATAAVCSPARSSLLTGTFATSLGTQNLRSETKVPTFIKTLPELLRTQGYFCSNNYKEDYNFDALGTWNESNKTAHWRNRKNGQPFYAVFNFETTHQSKIFGTDKEYDERFKNYLPLIQRTSPIGVQLPPYYIDTPLVRKLWARYYDNVKIVDLQIKELLAQLKADGLEKETIVFFFADHGTGMPRGKRALYNSGLKVPLIISAPKKYQDLLNILPNSVDNRMVSFEDFVPSVLDLAGLKLTSQMKGKSIFDLNNQREAIFATSDRVDEAFEMVRSVRTKRYSYLRNYYPQLPLIQANYYSDKSAIMKELRKELLKKPTLSKAQQSMWFVHREAEELYDLEVDPFETKNLVNDPKYLPILSELRSKNRDKILETRDLGFAIEAFMYNESSESTPLEAFQNQELYPLEKILAVIDELAIKGTTNEQIISYLSNEHPLIQYWTMIHLQTQNILTNEVVQKITQLMNSEHRFIRITAAETLNQKTPTKEALQVLLKSFESDNPYELLMAARAIELLGEKGAPIHPEVKTRWEKLKIQAKGKWKGYDLYATWALNGMFDEK